MREQLTSHRQTVLAVVKASKDHPTARQVFERAVAKSPRLSFATVYNSLKYLTANGLIRQVSFGEEAVRYDAILSRHDHLICRKCQRVDDLTSLTPPRPGTDFPSPTGFKIEEISVQIMGLCQNCQQE
jgi:Fur family peroxide stress response transcriptional regulator